MEPRAGLDILNKSDAIVSALSERGELSAAQLADSAGEPVSSTYRLLTQLVQLGWVERGSRRGLYRLGLFFMTIGGLIEERLDVREVALPAMRELQAGSGHTTYLCVRRETSAACIERLEGPTVRSLAMRLGDRLPLYQGAAPTAILANLADDVREPLIDEYAQMDRWPTAPATAHIRSRCEEIRERGYSISDQDVTPGVAAIGAPIFNHRGEVEASVSISSLRALVLTDLDATVASVIGTAAAISSALGYDETEKGR